MRFIRLENCKDGMIVGKHIYGQNGVMLLKLGTAIKQSHIDALQRLGYPGVYIDDHISKGIDIPELVNPLTQNRARQVVKNIFTDSKLVRSSNVAALFKEIEGLITDIIEQILSSKTMVASATSLKSFDNYTYQHCVDVGIISILIGREFKMTRSQLEFLGKAAFFHDIGKMFISKNILNKPSALTEEEFKEIKKHPQLGYYCLETVLKQPKELCNCVLYHHERYEGGGYPDGLVGDDIPLMSRIIAVADVYDAITSKRVYKDAIYAAEAYEYIMGNSNTHFDPEVVAAFLRKIPPFPIGTEVTLSDGRRALVVENRPSFMTRPLVKLLHKNDEFLDLTDDRSARSITIVGA